MSLRRGALVPVAIQGDFGKPRPALVIQSDLFAGHPSVAILPLTSDLRDAPLLRFRVQPDMANGLRAASDVMIDKPLTVTRDKLGEPFGALKADDLLQIDRLLAVFLGIAD